MKTTMKLLIILIACLSGFQALAQTLNYNDIKTEKPKGNFNQYISKDGSLYKEGDTLTIGKGSGVNGTFVYVSGSGPNGTYHPDAKIYNTKAIINNMFILGSKKEGWKVTVTTKGGFSRNGLFFDIENAMANGEVRSFGMTSDEALAELKKCKDKLDLGLITQEEFAKKKAELLKYIK